MGTTTTNLIDPTWQNLTTAGVIAACWGLGHLAKVGVRLAITWSNGRLQRLHSDLAQLSRLGSRSSLFVDVRGVPLQRGGLQYLVETSLRAAGVGDRRSPGALVHALRHTYATRLADDGATASEIMALLGHASLTTSQAYIDTTAVEQRRSAAANRTYRALQSVLDEEDEAPMPPVVDDQCEVHQGRDVVGARSYSRGESNEGVDDGAL